jgi:hypothetical protein
MFLFLGKQGIMFLFLGGRGFEDTKTNRERKGNKFILGLTRPYLSTSGPIYLSLHNIYIEHPTSVCGLDTESTLYLWMEGASQR